MITSTKSTTIAIPPATGNGTFLFVGASVADLGSPDTVAVNATYSNSLSQSQSAVIVGIAYPAQVRYEPVTGGTPIGPMCCQIVQSYSTSGSVSASAMAKASSKEEVSTDLVFSSLNRTGIYWVELSAVSLNGTTSLSPVSYLLLETAAAQGNTNGEEACGGQEAVGPVFADPQNGHVYVADQGTDAVSVIDGSTGRLVATISLPELVGQLSFSYDSSNGALYVGNPDSGQVFVIDTSANHLVGESVLSDSATLVTDSDNDKIFGVDFSNSLISVIDGSTNRIVATISGLQGPVSSTYSSGNNELYVETYNQTVFAIDGNDNRVVAKIPIPYEENSRLIYDPDNGILYAVTNGLPQNVSGSSSTVGPDGYLVMINTTSNTLLDSKITIPLPPGMLRPVLYDASNGDIYLYDGNSSLVAVDTTRGAVAAIIPVRGIEAGLVVESPSFFLDRSTGNIYATTDLNPSNGSTDLIEISSATNTVVSQVRLAGVEFGEDLAFDPINHVLFGAEGSSLLMVNVSSGVLEATTVLGTCAFGSYLP